MRQQFSCCSFIFLPTLTHSLIVASILNFVNCGIIGIVSFFAVPPASTPLLHFLLLEDCQVTLTFAPHETPTHSRSALIVKPPALYLCSSCTYTISAHPVHPLVALAPPVSKCVALAPLCLTSKTTPVATILSPFWTASSFPSASIPFCVLSTGRRWLHLAPSAWSATSKHVN